MLQVETNFTVAEDSPDHINPYGCVQDSNTNKNYINEILDHFKKPNIKVMDIGCAGGQLIVDHHNRGDIAVGIEGSSHVLNGKGKDNWKEYKNKCLFLTDASHPYKIKYNNEDLKFDYIQSWEVMEHIIPSRIDTFLTNIKNHLADDGLFCGSIANTPCSSGNHICLMRTDEWQKAFLRNGLSFSSYIFKNVLREDVRTCILFTAKIIKN